MAPALSLTMFSKARYRLSSHNRYKTITAMCGRWKKIFARFHCLLTSDWDVRTSQKNSKLYLALTWQVVNGWRGFHNFWRVFTVSEQSTDKMWLIKGSANTLLAGIQCHERNVYWEKTLAPLTIIMWAKWSSIKATSISTTSITSISTTGITSISTTTKYSGNNYRWHYCCCPSALPIYFWIVAHRHG